MKTRWSFYKLLVATLLQLSVLAGTALAYDISGTVEYAGTKAGRVFISIPQTQNGTLGTSVVFDGSATSVPYTIRGVPNGYYTVKAFLDPTGKGVLHASDPTGSVSNIQVNGDKPGVTITITNPASSPSPDAALPANVGVLHGSGADMVLWQVFPPNQGGGPVPADSYNLYWSTDPNVMGTYETSGGSRINIPATDDKSVFFNVNLGATPYNYVMKSVVNGTESTGFSFAGEMPVGTGSTVTGTVALTSGNPQGKKLFVVLGSGDGGPSNFAVLTTSGATQSFAITNVPDGGYWIFPVFDMNDNGLLDDGDIFPNDNGGGYVQVAGADVDAGTISFGAANVDLTVTTNYWKSNGMTGYSLSSELFSGMKTPVKVTFTGGTNIPDTAVDLGLSDWGGFQSWTNIPWTPLVGDTCTFDVTYADNSMETVTGYVTGVLDSLPTPVEPLSAIPYGTGTPTFTWSAPASPPPGNYGYSLSLWGYNGNNFWWSPNNFPSSQTSADFNFDGSASQPALTDGQTYQWRIAVFDQFGNSASTESAFTYAGAISGAVMDDWGNGIQNVRVNACKYDSGTNSCDWGFSYGTNTDENGDYLLVGLPDGEYKVQFNGADAGFISGWYDGATDINSALPVAVSKGGETWGIDAWLTEGGSISGTVTNSAAVGIQNVNVQVCLYDSGTNSCNWGFSGVNTDAYGNYTVGGLPEGDYKVQFNGSNLGYTNEWYDNTTDMNAAALQTVYAGSAVMGIDAVLDQGGSISGRVTSNGTTGIQNINVQVCKYDSVSNNCNGGFNQTNTDANGDYTLGGLPAGQYKVQFNGSYMGYVNEWYNDTTDMNAAAPQTVAVGATTTGINAVLAQGGSISGRVTDGTTGLANIGVAVYASNNSFFQIGWTQTDSNGNYVLQGLANGTYKVQFNAGATGYANRWYNNKADFNSALLVSVTAPGTTTLADAVLVPAVYYTITTTAGINGSLNPGGNVQVLSGDSQAFSVTVYPPQVLDAVGGTCGGTLVDTTFTTDAITQNCTVTLTTKLPSYLLTVNTAGTGSGSVTGAGTYNHGDLANVTATPTDANSIFAGWSGDCTGSQTSVSVYMDGPKTCTATFNAVIQAKVIHNDFDGDAKADIAVWRPSDGIWYIINSATDSQSVVNYGTTGDITVSGDYDGDGKTDIAVWRPSDGNWYVLNSAGTQSVVNYGTTGDTPVPGDFDGDGKTDIAVWRSSDGNWYIINSAAGTQSVVNYGATGDVPVPGDYDGDGKTDIAVWRSSDGNWYIINSATGTQSVVNYGTTGDTAVPGDYDGDGKTDIAVWRPSDGNWYIINSATGTQSVVNYGATGDVPVPGDYDGDGKTDIAVWRPTDGNWYIINSATGTQRVSQYGILADQPIK